MLLDVSLNPLIILNLLPLSLALCGLFFFLVDRFAHDLVLGSSVRSFVAPSSTILIIFRHLAFGNLVHIILLILFILLFLCGCLSLLLVFKLLIFEVG